MWIDSHAHLDDPDILSDLDGVLERASRADVRQILTVGCVAEEPDRCRRLIDLAKSLPGIWVSLGVHPHDARHYSDSLGDEIRLAMPDERVVAWGEIGLDYHYDNSPRDVQQEAFRRQVRLARAGNKPIIVHSREADEDLCRILEEEYAEREGPRGVLHCFTGSPETASHCLALGFHIGLGGILTFPKAQALRDLARTLPEDRILVETDSPYLAPVPYRGRRNEPAFVVEVGKRLAEVRDTTPERIARLTSDNFSRLFLNPG